MRKNKNRLKVIFLALLVLSSALPARAQSLIRDTEIENMLKEWSKPIFEAAHLNPDNVKIILVQNDAVNAFVAGGANIFIYTGLLQKTQSPEEIIGVIAHETGHIAGGHLIRTRDALERASYESIIGTVLGIGVAVLSGDANAAAALSAGGTGLAASRFLSHSRVQESSADQAALTYFDQAGLNPSGLATFMEKLKSESFVPETQQSEYVRTHPLVGNRIEALETRIKESPHKNKAVPEKWKRQHARMMAKLIGFINPGQVPWVYEDKDHSLAAEYARTIAAYRENKVEEALRRTDALLVREAENPYFLELKAQMLVDFGKVQEAVPIYRDALNKLPNAPLLQIALAHALIESSEDDDKESLNEAIGNLKRALSGEPRSGQIHRLLATAYGRIGQESEAKIHLAEEALLQRRLADTRQHAEFVLVSENEGNPLWLKAKDILSFLETMEKG